MDEGDYSLVVNNVQSRIASIQALCRSLALSFGRACGVNSYMSNAGQQGFPTHMVSALRRRVAGGGCEDASIAKLWKA